MAHQFRVWAPDADQLALVVGDEEVAMERTDDGWWTVSYGDQILPLRYQFRVDGNGPFPDPRSAWQPDGPHAPSSTWDHEGFGWTANEWSGRPLLGAVIYELHVGTFTAEGTYSAAIEKLGHLRELGVTHLELMPLATFPGRHGWGYDGVNLFAPHPAYGTPDELKRFIDAAHAHGIAVLLDVVYNHLGPDGNYLAPFAPYFTSRWKTPWGDAVNFDGPHCDGVREFFVDNTLMWLRDYRFDGLRLDAVHAIRDETALPFLEELSMRVEELAAESGRELLLIAECDLNDPRFVRPHSAGGLGLDAQWTDDFHHAVHAYFTGERDGYYADYGSMEVLQKAIAQAYVFDGQYHIGRKRKHGRPPIGLKPEQFVVFGQNHDHTGNRARGERLCALVGELECRAIAAITLLTPFTPMLFQGEEWDAGSPFLYFTDHTDPELAKNVSEGRVREFRSFGWKRNQIPDPQDPETFVRSKLDWTEPGKPEHQSALDWHRALIRIRKDYQIAAAEPASVDCAEDGSWIRWRVGQILVIINLTEAACEVPDFDAGSWELILSSGVGDSGSPNERAAHSTGVFALSD